MPSFDIINYSLRPNKSIQRRIVFEGVRLLYEILDLNELVYIGLGGIWFTDFQVAHKDLKIRDMVSIEANEVGFSRAKFNQPFKTVTIENGLSGDCLPELLNNQRYSSRPWLVWLDYDGAMNEDVVEDMRFLVEQAPPSSILLSTFNCVGFRYGKLKNRADRIRFLLGDVVPDDLSRDHCDEDQLPWTLSNYLLQYMEAVAAAVSRPGGFLQSFVLPYRDGANMTTIGGILPQRGAVPAVKSVIASKTWPGIAKEAITAPLLTLKEAAVLQAQLPRSRPLTRKAVRRLGFDLEENQIRSFEQHYRYYPNYAQITI